MKKLIINFLSINLIIGAFLFLSTEVKAIGEVGKITAQASEFAYVAPDVATINFSVETVDVNSQKAVEINNEKITKLLAAIKSTLAENETIKTSSYSLQPRYEYNNISKKSVMVGYSVTNMITVKLFNLQNVGKIIDIASKNGATEISGLNFSLQNSDKICKELTQRAVLKAKNEAMTVLEPLGKTIDKISNINYGCSAQSQYRPYRNLMMAKSAGTVENADSSVSIEEGETRVDASVTIVFTIK